MDILYKSLVTHLQTLITDLKWIDMETGQLEYPGESYPVQFPCCLIDIQEINWQSHGKLTQEGDVTIRFRIGFDIYEDTEMVAPDIDTALSRLKLLNDIHKVIHGFGGFILPDPNNQGKFLDHHFKRLVRKKTFAEKREDGLKVYQLEYVTNMMDLFAQPVYVPFQVTTLNVTPQP